MNSYPSVAIDRAAPGLGLPAELDRGRILRRGLLMVAVIGLAGLAIVLLPGLGSLRARFSRAAPGWIVLGVSLKVLSMLAYVVLFRAVFCRRMSWRASSEIAIAELGANAVIPAGGVGGLALGAWAMRRGGMSAQHIGRRTVSFFLITSAVNVIALVIVSLGLAVGVFAGHASLALTLIPAAVAGAAVIATIGFGRLARRLVARLERRSPGERRRAVRWIGIFADGVDETVELIAEHDRTVVIGAVGYLAFDVMLVWAMFHAFGGAPTLATVWIGYLIGQLGGIIPLPGGLGGVDGGLIATYTLYGVSAGTAAAAVLSYRAVALAIPATLGIAAFTALRRRVQREGFELALCEPGQPVDVGFGRVEPSPASAASGGGCAAAEETGADSPAAATSSCSHLNHVHLRDLPDPVQGCAECLRTGGSWFHLRMCQTCGAVGCCDSSPGRHASAHAHDSGHPIVRSAQPGEDWSWCYVDELMFRLVA